MRSTRKVMSSHAAQTLAIMAVASFARASAAQPPTAFEVTSIHRNLSGSDNSHLDIARGRLVAHASLRTLIRSAYDIQNFQLAGGPGWLDTDMYDIAATTGTGQETSDVEFRALIRNLLADRFQLKVHWETRQTNVYALVVARNGPTLKEDLDLSKETGVNTNISAHEGRMIGTRAPTSYLANVLANKLGRTVIDKTGLQSRYDWTLVWDPNPTADSIAPSIFTALREQSGLKLDPQKGPTEFLVIDGAHQPTEN